MLHDKRSKQLWDRYVDSGSHEKSDYFGLIKALLKIEDEESAAVKSMVSKTYQLIEDEIISNNSKPLSDISFGTSGWRGVLGKDIFKKSVTAVTAAIVRLYQEVDLDKRLAPHLGVSSLAEAQRRGCLVGFDNRFGGDILGRTVADYLLENGFNVYYCAETTTGVLSAALRELGGAFSVNLTPSHNPLEYGGYKYNAADAGPAASELTSLITRYSREFITSDSLFKSNISGRKGEYQEVDSLELWQDLVKRNKGIHGIDYPAVLDKAAENRELSLVIDCVHGASRLHLGRLLGPAANRLTLLRGEADVSFGGIAPEPSSVNMQGVVKRLGDMKNRLKIGAIIDPDGDRIRFTDGSTEISMNQFGAMAYEFLHENKGLKGMVAKTVATSNMANSIAKKLGEEIFEPRVGFKEFKPVIGKALVMFEESDGISIIGHTPEKDAYIGLLLAIDMVLTKDSNLGEIKVQLEKNYGAFFPDRDGVEVSLKGSALHEALKKLEKYDVGSIVKVGSQEKVIQEVITIDGRKMIFEDDSWVMIRPSGTEPKVRFYVESRDPDGTDNLVKTARGMLTEAGLL